MIMIKTSPELTNDWLVWQSFFFLRTPFFTAFRDLRLLAMILEQNFVVIECLEARNCQER